MLKKQNVEFTKLDRKKTKIETRKNQEDARELFDTKKLRKGRIIKRNN